MRYFKDHHHDRVLDLETLPSFLLTLSAPEMPRKRRSSQIVPHQRIKTQRLHLRETRDSDLDDLHELLKKQQRDAILILTHPHSH